MRGAAAHTDADADPNANGYGNSYRNANSYFYSNPNSDTNAQRDIRSLCPGLSRADQQGTESQVRHFDRSRARLCAANRSLPDGWQRGCT